MNDLLPPPTTARILQISPKETITYEMPWSLYLVVKDALDFGWPKYRGIEGLFDSIAAVVPNVRELITVTREVTREGVKGFSPDMVWYDECGSSNEGEGES